MMGFSLFYLSEAHKIGSRSRYDACDNTYISQEMPFFFERLPGLFPASGGGHRLLERLQVLAVVVHGRQNAPLVLGLGGGVARVVDLEKGQIAL